MYRPAGALLDRIESLVHVGHLEVAADGGRTARLSAEARRILDWPEGGPDPAWDEVVERRVHAADRDRVRRELERAYRRSGPNAAAECRIVQGNGEIRFVHAMAAPLPPGAQLLVALRDVTGDRQHEDRVGLTTDRLANVGRWATVGEIATGICHDVTQPLTAIGNYSQAALRVAARKRALPADVREMLQAISEQAQRAGRVVQHLRELSARTVDGAVPARLVEVAATVVALARAAARRCGVELELRGGPDTPIVTVQVAAIELALLNIVMNAIDATAAASRLGPVQIRCSRSERYAEVAVEDRGYGLRADAEMRLFEPFYTTKKDGTGFGLPIARSVAERHRGRVLCERNAHGGMTFTLMLPCTPEAA